MPALLSSSPPKSGPAEFKPEDHIYKASELAAMDFPPVRELVPGIIREGLSILGGPPKVGKSFLALDIALGLAQGEHVLGLGPVERQKVLYLALEDSPRRMRDRIALRLTGKSFPSLLHLVHDWPRLMAGGLSALTDFIKKEAYHLVIIDTFVRVKEVARPKAMELYSFDYAQAEKLKRLADENQLSLLIIHHLRKMIAEDPVDSLNGSTGMAAAADSILILQRHRGEGDARLFITGRDIEEQTLALAHEDTGWKVLGSAGEYGTSDTKRRILNLLRTCPAGNCPKDIAGCLQINSDTVRQALLRMNKAGQVYKKDGNYFAIPP